MSNLCINSLLLPERLRSQINSTLILLSLEILPEYLKEHGETSDSQIVFSIYQSIVSICSGSKCAKDILLFVAREDEPERECVHVCASETDECVACQLRNKAVIDAVKERAPVDIAKLVAAYALDVESLDVLAKKLCRRVLN